MMVSKIRNILFYVAAMLLVLSAMLYIADNEILHKTALYVYAISGALVAVELLSNPYQGENLRLKRLNVQQAIAAILLPLSSYFMFKGKNEWFMFLLVSAFLILYVTIIKIRTEKKEKSNGDNEFSERKD